MRCVQVFRADSNCSRISICNISRTRCTNKRDDLGGVLFEVIRKLRTVIDQVTNVYLAVVLLEQNVFADLISVYEDIVDGELHDEVHKRLLDARGRRGILATLTLLTAE